MRAWTLPPTRFRLSSLARLLDFARTAHLIDGFALERYRPGLHEARAELARVLGDEAGHARELREAHRLYVAMGADGHVQRLATELAP